MANSLLTYFWSKTALSFPLKSNWKIITNYLDNQLAKRTLVIDKAWNTKILEWYKKEYLEDKNNLEVIVAFNPNVNAKRYIKLWRTYIWIKDSKHIVFFIAKNRTQDKMNKLIKDYWIEEENIIMLD